VATDLGIKTIYVHLLDEGTEVLRPTAARQISDLVFLLLEPEDYDEEDEEWQFPPGSLVRCVAQVREQEPVLVATELLDA
jgi:hypothetical protein